MTQIRRSAVGVPLAPGYGALQVLRRTPRRTRRVGVVSVVVIIAVLTIMAASRANM